jgi:hypothetical protein
VEFIGDGGRIWVLFIFTTKKGGAGGQEIWEFFGQDYVIEQDWLGAREEARFEKDLAKEVALRALFSHGG